MAHDEELAMQLRDQTTDFLDRLDSACSPLDRMGSEEPSKITSANDWEMEGTRRSSGDGCVLLYAGGGGRANRALVWQTFQTTRRPRATSLYLAARHRKKQGNKGNVKSASDARRWNKLEETNGEAPMGTRLVGSRALVFVVLGAMFRMRRSSTLTPMLRTALLFS